MSTTKIVVVKRKKLIVIGVAAAAMLLLIILIAIATRGNNNDTTDMGRSGEKLYTAGVYAKQVSIGDMVLNLEVLVDENHINAVDIKNVNEVMTTMYPLISPSVDAIEAQLIDDIPIEEVMISEDSMYYTQTMLLEVIGELLEQARLDL